MLSSPRPTFAQVVSVDVEGVKEVVVVVGCQIHRACPALQDCNHLGRKQLLLYKLRY